jgi:hypothetical protein
MSTDVALLNKQLPAHLQGVNVPSATDEFAGGVQSGFAVLSIKGRVWRAKIKGEEHAYVDDNDDAIPSLELVLVRSNPNPSKIFYDKRYEDGDEGKPTCFSPDGIKPDAEVTNPIHHECATCPNNAWGSRITESGKKSRACSDNRRMVVTLASELEKLADNPDYEPVEMLLRVPPASLNPLKEYVLEQLKPKGVEPFMLVTRVGFDNSVEFPRLTFRPSRFLTEDEYNHVLSMRESDTTNRILQSAAEYSGGGTTDSGDESEAGAPAAAEAKAAPPATSDAPKKKKKKKKAKRDATAAEAEAAAAAAAVEAEPDEDEEDNDPIPTVAEEPETEEAEEATSDGDEDEFESMLDSILDD